MKTASLTGLGLLALALASAGCEPPCCDGPPALRIGTSDARGVDFVPLLDGGRVALYPGTQGAAHVYFHAQIDGIDPTTLALERRVEDPETGTVFVIGRGPVDVLAVGPGRYELDRAVRVVLCPDEPPPEGRTVRVTLSASDAEGRAAEDTRDAVVSCDGSRGCLAVCGPQPEP